MNKDQKSHVQNILERLARVITNEASMSELKPAQWEALRFFSQANRFSCTPSGLTSYMRVTKGTVSQTINALERKGLLEKKQGKEDRRAINIALTQRGQNKLNQDPLQDIFLGLSDISSEKLDMLSSTLEDLLTNSIKRRAGSPFGVCKTCQHFERNAHQGKPHLCALLQAPLSDEDSNLICQEHTKIKT